MPSSGRILFAFQSLRYCEPGLDLYLEEKIKIKKADVKVEGTGPYEGRWTVPITMLQKILK